jgi:predicted Zn finger-like uncharacterized protein
MLIVCPNCATSYDVELASLRPSGRQVRCVRCRTVWHAELPHAEQLVAAAEALGPAPPAPVMVEAMAEAGITGAPRDPEPAAPQFESAEAAPPDNRVEVPAREPVASQMNEAEGPENASGAGHPAIETESPPLAPTDLDAESPPPAEIEEAEPIAPSGPLVKDIESVAARRRRSRDARRTRLRWPLSRLQTAMMALIVADAIIVCWRVDFVRAMPQTASFFSSIGMPVNLRGLDFDSLTTATEQHDDMPILVVSGNIINDTADAVTVPHLRFAVRNAAQQEIYSWTAMPSRASLPPGEGISFRTRLASPPPDAHDVLVRFLTRYDMLNGSR